MFIRKNTIECANKYLNECIAKTAKKRLAYSNSVQKKGGRIVSELSKDEIYEICGKFTDFPSRVIDVIQIMNYGKRLHIIYLTVQKLSNGLGGLSS